MIRWVRSHPFTLLGAFVLAVVITVNVIWPLHWYEYLWSAAGVGVSAAGGWLRRRRDRHDAPPPWRPSGPSLPCPAGCRIRVAHRHDPVEAFR